MGTFKFYPNQSVVPTVSPAYDASWGTVAAAGSRIRASTTRIDDDGKAWVNATNFVGSSLGYQMVTPADALPVGLTTGTITTSWGGSQKLNAAVAASLRLLVKVVSSDGLTFRGVLADMKSSDITVTTAAGQTIYWKGALNPVTIQSGDRLVFEIGAYVAGATADSPRHNYTTSPTPTGQTDSPAQSGNAGSDFLPWIEITLTEAVPPRGKLMVKGALPSRLRRASNKVPKAYLGDKLVWDASSDSSTEGPKIDPSHPLAQRTVIKRLTNGALEGMTADTNYIVADSAFASKTAGTVSFLKENLPSFPAGALRTLRMSALIKVDKTPGRYSAVGFATAINPTSSTADLYIGHTAGSGIRVNSFNFAISISVTAIDETRLVDGAWYRVSMVWDSVLDQAPTSDTTNTGRNRVTVAAEPVGDPGGATVVLPWYPANQSAKMAMSYTPMSITARTNSALGTVRDLTFVDSALGVAGDNAPIMNIAKQGAGTNTSDNHWIYSKGKAAPLRVIVTAGGSGVYGGGDFATAVGRTGTPYDTWRSAWRRLADLGYTTLHTTALHEGWGADDHLAKQLEAYNRINAEFGGNARLYYLGYSMGGLSAWRAIMGKAGYPPIRAAYIVAGAIGLDRYYDTPMYSAIKTRWPDRGALDEPANYLGSDLIARGTRVRLVTSTTDTNVPKVDNHDVMKAKYAGSPLFSELVHTGIDHFNPTYWNVDDIVAFYEGQDI